MRDRDEEILSEWLQATTTWTITQPEKLLDLIRRVREEAIGSLPVNAEIARLTRERDKANRMKLCSDHCSNPDHERRDASGACIICLMNDHKHIASELAVYKAFDQRQELIEAMGWINRWADLVVQLPCRCAELVQEGHRCERCHATEALAALKRP